MVLYFPANNYIVLSNAIICFFCLAFCVGFFSYKLRNFLVKYSKLMRYIQAGNQLEDYILQFDQLKLASFLRNVPNHLALQPIPNQNPLNLIVVPNPPQINANPAQPLVNAPPILPMTIDEISALQRRPILEEDIERFRSAGSDTICSICNEELEADTWVIFLPCKHNYHPECITEWLTKQKSTCPLCRKNAREQYFFEIENS